MIEKFEISQSALLVNDNKLLILKIPSKQWVFVWWKINKDESYIEALQREVNEEIGLQKIYIEKILEVDNWIYNWIPKYWIFFKCTTNNINNIILSDEHIDYKWIDWEEIGRIHFFHEKMRQIALSAIS